jgi:Reverse transcriptase (RNA-dependent DNA polymerase)/Endonuclease-reverse transcriptase
LLGRHFLRFLRYFSLDYRPQSSFLCFTFLDYTVEFTAAIVHSSVLYLPACLHICFQLLNTMFLLHILIALCVVGWPSVGQTRCTCTETLGSSSVNYLATPIATVVTRSYAVTPCASLMVFRRSCLAVRGPCGGFFRPSFRRSRSCVLVALLLLLGGVESNPGPAASYTRPASLNIGSLNARSAINKGALVRDIIESNQLDILAINETWITADDPDSIRLDAAPPNYVTRHFHCSNPGRKTKRNGGLAIIHRETLTVRPHPLQTTLSVTSFHFQAVNIISSNFSFLLINIYRWPDSNLNTFITELDTLLSAATTAISTDRLVVCGDFNCPGATASTIRDDLSTTIDAFGLKQLVTSPTHSGPYGDSLLDLVITAKDSTLLDNLAVCNTHGVSDHCLVKWTVARCLNRRQPTTVFYRNLKSLDLDAFRTALSNSPLFTAPEDTVDGFASQIDDVVTDILDQLAPIRQLKKCPGKKINRWLSDAAIEAKRLRRRLERRWKATGDILARRSYRAICRQANKLINESRMQHCCSSIADKPYGSRQQWSAVRDVLHATTPSELPSNDDCIKRCTVFSDYFIGKIKSIKISIATLLTGQAGQPGDPLEADLPHVGPRLLVLQPVNADEILKLLSSLPGKSSSMDAFPTSLLKSCADIFTPIIVRLCNLSFASGRFPAAYRSASVTPLLKKPGLDPDDPANYRPISNLNTLSKILERVFLARLIPQVNASNNFNIFQSAYRKYHSTETALLKILDDVYRNAGQLQSTLLIGLDLSAAFDTIDKSTLIARLRRSFGVEELALDWISSYLSDRSQHFRVGSSRSPPSFCEHGVPQGSVLGPILFSLYIAPVANVISAFNVNHHQYADDTQLYIALDHINPGDTCSLTPCTAAVCRWFLLNGLSLNPNKSEAILLGTPPASRHTGNPLTVNIAGAIIPVSPTLKSLGVTLDSKLSFQQHINSVCKASYFHLRSMRHVRSCLPPQILRTVACSIVSAKLDYCNSIMFGTTNENIHRLQLVQNSLARLVTGTRKFDHITPVLAKLHWLPVSHRITYKIAVITHKILSTSQPGYLFCSIHRRQLPDTVATTRSTAHNHLTLPNIRNFRSEFSRRGFSNSAPAIWNNLPSDITDTSVSRDVFVKRLKTHLFRLAYAD